MKTLRKFKKNAKALSPVVASIILIAVTVAVSIAVAAWMGALTIGFMGGSEQVEVRNIAFSAVTSVNNNVTVAVKNTGTSAVTIQEVWVNNVDKTSIAANTVSGGTLTIPANTQIYITIQPYAWTAGDNYQVKLVTAKGNSFMRNAIPPS